MLRKLDLLMLKSFVGPFILTTGVSTFILLIQYLLKYFDDFVGKNLGFTVFAELLFYFSLNMLQNSLPLGVLVASLMTFGNLGENFELTAIKSAGISLVRILRPIFIFVIFLSIGAYFFNNYTIPAANLKAYSLLYDIKHTKPALDIKEGAFYNGIPDYSIKVKEKYPDGKTLRDVIIYDHSQGRGNKTIILADSSIMYTILDDRYLKLELYDGHYYSEQVKSSVDAEQFYRTEYTRMDLVFSLSSFDLKRRKEELFQNNRQMKNIKELSHDIDSFKVEIVKQKARFIQNTQRYFQYHLDDKPYIEEQGTWKRDTTKTKDVTLVPASMFPANLFDFFRTNQKQLKKKQEQVDTLQGVSVDSTDVANAKKIKKEEKLVLTEVGIDSLSWEDLERYVESQHRSSKALVSNALNKARNIKVNLSSSKTRVYQLKKDTNLYTIERDRKYALAMACIIMFTIGAPLGAIIKKGGLGVPTIIAIFFFIIYYVFGSIGEKQAKEGAMNPYLAVWMSNLVLFPFGLFFLRQARIDARIFEVDIYHIWIEKLRSRFARKNKEV
ncbi:MAG: hypothetical protein Tsb0034_20630 [Ekhidna sp.]